MWRTSTITEEGILCSVCGGKPDWKKHPPTLAYKSRYKRVAALCAEGSDFQKSYDELEQSYGDFIEGTYTGMPVKTKDIGWRYFSDAWKTVDSLADYLLTAPDVPTTNYPHSYTERGLQRRYYDPRRKCNVSSLTDLNLQPQCDEGGTQFTDQEVVEIISPHSGYSRPLCDVYFADEFLKSISDPMERSIAYDLSSGATKRDIERQYGLTERQVRTRVAHIAKALKNI